MKLVVTFLLFLLALPLQAQPLLSFMERDLDGNGRLTLEESLFDKLQFQELDESRNGELSLGEFNEYWKQTAPVAAYPSLSFGQHPQQVLDLYLPRERERRVPLVLWIHGGSWQRGSKDGCPFQTLTERGFAVASVDYRLAPGSKFPAQYDDVRSAVRRVGEKAEELGFEIGSTTAVGLSAGGHLALLLGAKGEVDDVIAFGTPVDLADPRGREYHQQTLEALFELPLEEAALQAASPVRVVERGEGRFLIFHGLEDRTIPWTQALQMARAAGEKGRAVQLVLVPDGSHTLTGGIRGWDLILEFLRNSKDLHK